MERQPRHPEDDNQSLWTGGEDARPVEVKPRRARDIIEEGIERAAAAEEEVEDWVARHIALQLNPQDGSALELFVRTGELADDFPAELVRGYERRRPDRQRWIDSLGTYALHRADRGPVDRWEERALARNLFDAAWRLGRQRSQRYQEQLALNREIQLARDSLQHVSDEVAVRLMVQLAPSPHSALARFAAERVVTDAMREELRTAHQSGDEQTRRWLSELSTWLADRGMMDVAPWLRSPDSDEVATVGPDTQPATDEPQRDEGRQMAVIEELLAPLPDLGDIPRPPAGRSFDTGYDWMNALPEGWHAEPSWGRDGWDLGAWPLIVVALYADDERGRYAVATFVEGSVTMQRYPSRERLNAAVDEIAEFHWRLGQASGPQDLPEGQGLLEKHTGPFSWQRLNREREYEEPDPDDTEA